MIGNCRVFRACHGIQRCAIARRRGFLLKGLFHAERVNHQFELFDNLRRMPGDVGFDCLVPNQLRQITFGDDEVEKFRSIVLLGILVFGLDLTHFALKTHDLRQRIATGLVWFWGWGFIALLGRGGFQQRVGVGRRDAVSSNHQLHGLDLARGLGIADAAPVTHENFRQWVIEDDFCA